ncbi:hypothetical protein [Fictibacillus sp. KU28468]|uniref:hypothetical protein n=1 Tax=Fictibacillus sp. KU28468 TaxID=2991053 RepID=UPI0006A7ECDA|nr:hypothetical protein [Fictibacillus sp. KU28468]UZJ77537.1 hypothetical protein OKX00_15325 [Fictibacillus sp. KU28468]
MKKRSKIWAYSEMVLLFLGFLLALWNGMYINSPALLFGILAAVFLFRAIERYYFKLKTEFFFNTAMVLIFILLAVMPLLK